MLKIRLSRGGSKKRPYYTVVVADSAAARDGKFIEKVGTYNPMLPKDAQRVTLKVERIAEWLKKGAQPTDRVARFLSQEGLVTWQHGNNPVKGKPHKKAEERAAERTQRETDRAEAEAAAREEAAAAREAAKAEAEAAKNAPAPEPEPVAEDMAEEAPAAEAPAEEVAAPEAAAPEAAPAEDAPAAAEDDAPAAE